MKKILLFITITFLILSMSITVLAFRFGSDELQNITLNVIYENKEEYPYYIIVNKIDNITVILLDTDEHNVVRDGDYDYIRFPVGISSYRWYWYLKSFPEEGLIYNQSGVMTTQLYSQPLIDVIACNFDIKKNGEIIKESDELQEIPYHDYYINDDGLFLGRKVINDIHEIIKKFEKNRQIQVFYNSENNNDNIESRIIQLAQTRLTGLDSAGIIQIYQNNNGLAIIFSNYSLTSFSGFKYSEYARKFLRSNNIAHGLTYLYNETLNQPLYEKTEYGKGPLWFKRTNFNYDYSTSYALDKDKIVSRYEDLSSNYELKHSKLNDYIFIDATWSILRDTGLDNKDSLFTHDASGYDYYSSLYEKYCRLYIRDVVIPYETPYPTATPIIYTPVPSPTSTSYLLTPTQKPTSDTELDFDSDDLLNMTDGLGGIFRDDYFNNTFEALRRIEDNDVSPSFKLNLRNIVSTITDNEYVLTFFSNEDVEYIDFSILQEKKIFEISIIQFFRYFLSAHFVWITLFKIISILQSPFNND